MDQIQYIMPKVKVVFCFVLVSTVTVAYNLNI